MSGSSKGPLVTVIVPTRNRATELRRCLNSVLKSDYPKLEVIVVDDCSAQPPERTLGADFPGVKFLRNPMRSFLSYSRNRGARESAGDYLFFLDDDNVIAPDTIGLLLRPLACSKFSVSTPVIYFLAEPERVWTSYITKRRFPGFYKLHTDLPRGPMETFSFHNSFMVRRTAFEELGGFDTRDFPVRFSELDLAHRMHARGYVAVLNPQAKVWHDVGWALVHMDKARAYYTERNRMLLLKRYYRNGEFRFYAICILPFLVSYYLVHHSLSSLENPLQTAASFMRGVVDGLRLRIREKQIA